MKQRLSHSIKTIGSTTLRYWPYVTAVLISGIITWQYSAASAPAVQKIPTGQIARQPQTDNQLETTTGAPAKGRNPASQQQTALGAAASQPIGAGQRTSRPAADLKGDKRRVNPADVLPDTKKTGMLANGCLADYGRPGEECVPSYAVSQANPCQSIRRNFPGGVVVSGSDRFNLDTNRNGTACDPKDS